MQVPAGTVLGECEVLAPLGAGGMGEVYRARDKNLGREVAIKVLPEGMASDSDRLRRFEQEARAAASLNHPNIIAIYRFGATDAHIPYLVTELLQGQTLRERLLQGRIPVRKVLDYALQIARGLAAAHERGIVHRDLKPENIFLTRDSVVKVLDFGLVRLTSPEIESPQSQVDTIALTEPGIVLGTAGYMSPEQVRGQTADQRSDIFSLGSVIYEMISGRRAFQGATQADTMSAVLKEDPPDLTAEVPNMLPALGRIVSRCLEKDPAERFQSARDLAFNLGLLSRNETGSRSAAATVSGKRARWKMPLLSALALMLAAAAGFMAAGRAVSIPRNSEPVVLRRLTDFIGMEESPALSPDGKSVAFTADVSGRRQVWVRLLAGGTPLQITHDDADHSDPRWSPDSSSLIYFSANATDGEGKIWEVPALGGPARPLVNSFAGGDLSHDGKSIAFFRPSQGTIEIAVADRDGSHPRTVAQLASDHISTDLRWSPDDSMIGFQSGRVFDYDIYFVPASGGAPKKITEDGNPLRGYTWLRDSSGVIYSSPLGESVLYLPTTNLWAVEIGEKNARQLTFGETSYVSPDLDRNGNLVVSRLRINFDLWKFPVMGSPEENVARGIQITHQTGLVQTPSVGASDHQIAYLSDSGGHGNVWTLDTETGNSRQITFEHDPQIAIGVPVWSPDGKHIAYVDRSHTNGWNVDQWIVDPDGANAHRISVGGGWSNWSPDSRWLYISQPDEQGRFHIEKVSPDGATKVVVRKEGLRPALAADGTLYYTVDKGNDNGSVDVEVLRARPETGDPSLLVNVPGTRLTVGGMITQPLLSPDGKWLVLALTEGAATDLWLQPTDGGPMRRVTNFGRQATFITRRVSWSVDGKSIFAAVGKGESDIVLLSNLAP